MSVKKVKRSRKDSRVNVHDCACVRVYGAKHCVAEWDSKTDRMWYKGIPCMHCGVKINKWEDEYKMCDECAQAEMRVWEQHENDMWYGETVIAPLVETPMHQDITARSELEELLGL
jgi:hypothetical protein